MSLDFLPKELKDIIITYKNQLEFTEKFEEVLDEFDELVEQEYTHNEHDKTVYWGYTVYEEKRLNDLDLLMVSRADEFYNPTCIIYNDTCYYNQEIINHFVDELIEEEIEEQINYFGGNLIDIDDVDEDWIWRDMVEYD